MHCRMCSQRLPRPGRLCRECEQELNFSRSAAKALATMSSPNPGMDESLLMSAATGWTSRLPRSTVFVAALAAGISVAAAFGLDGWRGATPRDSVMIDRNLAAIHARASRPTSAAPSRGTAVAANTGMSLERSPDNPRVASATSGASVAYDRVLALANALDGCALESPFARLACEERARASYCHDAGGRIPQCADASPQDQVR